MSQEPVNRLFLTNNYSIVSKYSAVKTGYHEDKVLEQFIESYPIAKSWRRTPLVNRGYAARLLAMDWKIHRSKTFDHVDCFIVLGAGYDTSSLRPATNANCCWIELDLPQVVETKSKFIQEKKLFELIKNEQLGILSSTTGNYHLANCDLRDTRKLASILSYLLSRLNFKNVAIINEVCLCYLEIKAIKLILETVVKCAQDSNAARIHYIGYEQVRPSFGSSGFEMVMIDHFKTIGHPLNYFPEPENIRHLLSKELGFHHITVASMYQIYHNALLAQRLDIKAFCEEPFDEFEEMDLYLGHYALVTGVMVLKDPFLETKIKGVNDTKELDDKLQDLSLKCPPQYELSFRESEVKRYGQAICLVNQSESKITGMPEVLISGGFGAGECKSSASSNKQHRRLSDCSVLNLDNLKVSPVQIDEAISKTICLDRMHGQIGKVSNEILFFDGGRQSPISHKWSNVPFIARYNLNHQLTLSHQFDFDETRSVLRWRHKLSPIINGDKMYQVGGLSIGNSGESKCPVVIWDLSSSRFGFSQPLDQANKLQALDRHSFGLDMRDASTMLIFGGLQTGDQFKDRSLDDSESNALLWDTRQDQLIKLGLTSTAACYGANVHFISDNIFIRLGGISTKSGLEEPAIGLFDLRKCDHQLASKIVPRPDNNEPVMLTNSASCHLKWNKKIITIGGGGNYFTFGTNLNKFHLVFDYNSMSF